MLRGPIAFATVVLILAPFAAGEVTFKKVTVEKKNRSEGVAVADINKDSRNDVIVGDVWYEAPDWKIREIRKPADLKPTAYSDAFGVHADDFNGDGWVDVIVIPFHGKDAKWYENPKGKEGHWTERVAFKGTGNETRLHVDLFGDGKPVFLMGVEGQLAWVSVPKDPTGPWDVHPIGGKAEKNAAHKFAHGLGVGDVNGDGRNDVLTGEEDGWFEQPPEGRKAKGLWKQHPGRICAGCADMYAVDFDEDGQNDVLSSSAHGRGIWFNKQTDGKFKTHTLNKEIPVTHVLHYVDVNGDGKRDIVTGQRPGTHGSTKFEGDCDLYWFEIKTKKGETPTLVPHKIDNQSGVGTQAMTLDINGDGLMDIAVSNKKGVFLFLQEKK